MFHAATDMSAKKTTPPAKPAAPAAVSPASAPVAPTAAATVAQPAWIDSPDPRKRLIGRIAFWALWIYVAALWLLALDQWFNWGIFGPKIPPVP